MIPSPSQGVWYLGPVAIRAYAICIIAGIVVAVWWGNRRFVARGGRPGRITDLAVWMVPFGLIGGRLYHVITDHELYFGPGRNPWAAFAIWQGGLGIWGAIALGAFGAWLGCRYYRIPLAPVADALAPGIVVAQAIGRLGNWFNQELFGAPTTLPWGLEVYVRTPGGVPFTGDAATLGSCEFPTEYIKAVPEVLCTAQGSPTGTYHPTFLYELIWNLLVAALIVWADKRFRMGGGRVFALYVAGYTLGRGWIEMLRIDPARTQLFGLRINVITSLVLFIAAVVFLIVRRKVGREDPATLQGRASGGERMAELDEETAAVAEIRAKRSAHHQDDDAKDAEDADDGDADDEDADAEDPDAKNADAENADAGPADPADDTEAQPADPADDPDPTTDHDPAESDSAGAMEGSPIPDEEPDVTGESDASPASRRPGDG